MQSAIIPNGDAGVSATIALMKGLVFGRNGVRSPLVRRTALEAVRGTERGLAEVDAVFDWVRRHVEFRGEYGETLQSPEATIRFAAGDCDDQSTLAAALLESLGISTRFVTVALRSSPDELSHVYVEAFDPRTQQWLSIDPTVEASYPGWEPDNVVRAESYSPNRESGLLVGLGLLALGLAL